MAFWVPFLPCPYAVQRNIVAERVLGLPRDIDVEEGKTWSEARKQ